MRVRGFTLIELMLVLAVLGIAFQLVAPAFAGRITDLRSHGALQQIVALLAMARQEALLRNHSITVCARDPSSGECSRSWDARHEIEVFIDANGNRRRDSQERVLRSLRWPLTHGELSWRASLARPYIEFEDTGGTWQNGTLYYCPRNRDARFARALVISHSGRGYTTVDSNGDGLREDRLGRNLSC